MQLRKIIATIMICVLSVPICLNYSGKTVFAEELQEDIVTDDTNNLTDDNVIYESTFEDDEFFDNKELIVQQNYELSEDNNLVFQQDINDLEEVDFLVGASNGITTAAIDNICKKYGYANGKYWTYNGSANKTKYTASTTPAGTNGYQGYSYPLDKGWQCWAFARYLMTQVTGEYVGEGKWKKISAGNVSSLQVGDVVCVGDSVHTAVVYKDLGGGKFQFIEVWGSYGNKIAIGGYNGSSDRNTLAKIKSYGLQYVYRWNGSLGPSVTNVKTTVDSNGATIECDVTSSSGLSSISMTAWVAADGYDNGKYKTYTPQSVNGLHYTFRVNISDLNNKRGEYKSNIFINGSVNYRDLTYTIPNPANNIPQGHVDIIESKSTNTIHIAGWAFDPDITSKSLDIHVYVGGTSSPSVPCYPIKANKERKDVNNVYGCGNYHGFDETITVNKTGNISVYVYAIDGNGVNANPMIGSKTITMHTHTYDSVVITKSATCTNDGVKTYTCKTCGEKKTESIAKLGHQVVNDAEKKPTCISTGLTEGSHCSRCGTIIKAQNIINATGHSWDNGTVTKKATATEDGEKTYKCSNCSETKKEVIKATGQVSDNTKTTEDGKSTSKDENQSTEYSLNNDNNVSDKTELNSQEMTQEVTQDTKKVSDGTISTTGIYCSSTNPSIVAGMVTEKSNPADVVEYKWLVCEESEGIWTEVSPWTQNNEWIDWKPVKSGNYIFVCQARVVGNEDASLISASFGTPYTKNDGIMEICQMPYWGEGGGYLIGFESFDNPNQEYQYEMFVMDLSLFSSGAPIPWVYRTGAITLTEGKTLWTIWQPEYGYYLTLFRLYDKDGKIIDEVCYGFANAY